MYGGMREIIFFDGKKVLHIYRSFGSVKELEPNLKLFIDRIKDKYCKAYVREAI